jgi:hypothetical protein
MAGSKNEWFKYNAMENSNFSLQFELCPFF